MAETERKQIDWESVEKHYRAGKLSIREIGRQCGCDEKQVRRRAKAEGWYRDLSEKINEAVRSKVVRSSDRHVCKTSRYFPVMADILAGVKQYRDDANALYTSRAK